GAAVPGRQLRRGHHRLRPAQLRRPRRRPARVPARVAAGRAPGGAGVPASAARPLRNAVPLLLPAPAAAPGWPRQRRAPGLRLPARVGARLPHPRGAHAPPAGGRVHRRGSRVTDLRGVGAPPCRRAPCTEGTMNDGPLSPQGKAAARTMVTLGGPVRDELLGGFEFEFELNTDASLIDQRWNDFDERHERRYGLAIEHLKSRVKGRAYD